MFDRRQCCAWLAATPVAGLARAEGPALAWRLATGYRADSLHGLNLRHFAAEVAQATTGALRIDLHAEGSLVPLGRMLAGLQAGEAEAGEAIMTGLVKDIPLAGADSVPFIVRSHADARHLWRHQRPLIESQLATRGLRVRMAVPWPPQGLYARQPIRGVEDLRGLAMRTYNSTTVRIAELLGARAVDVPMIDVGRAVAEGRLDTMITSAVTGVENRVWGGLKYFYPINAWFPKNLVMVREEVFQRLPRDHRARVLAAAVASEARGWQASEHATQASVETLRANGMHIEPVNPEFAQALRRLGEKFSLEWVRSVGPDANQLFIAYFTRT